MRVTRPDAAQAVVQNCTVLIVDDTPANLETLYSYFESLGFEIMMAQSGQAALRRVQYARPDIILLDVLMPGLDGFETCRRLKEDEATKNIPVIFMTALAETEHKVKGFQVGAADYITKPFQLDEVLARVQIHLALRNLQKQLETQNARLQQEIDERKQVEEALQQAKDELELRVQQRTNELARVNASLKAEIVEREQAEKEIRKLAGELEQQVANRTRELATLYNVTALASESLDLTTVLRRALEQVLKAMQSQAGMVHLIDETKNNLRLTVQQGLPDGIASQPGRERLDEGLIQWIMAHHEALIIPDISADQRAAYLAPIAPNSAYAGVPIRAGGRVLGALSVLQREPGQPYLNELNLLSAIADHVGILVESTYLRQRAEQAAVLEERGRLARELHDSVTQLLYSINLFAKAGRDAYCLDHPEQGDKYLTRLEETGRQALKEMRLLLYELRPVELEQEGLVGAIQLRLDGVEGRAGVKTQLLVNTVTELTKEVEEELYHIVQEALNNALKHSHASAVSVRLEANQEQISLNINDNGAGFNINEMTNRGGMGLVNMRERAERLGGELTITSSPGNGTAVEFSLKNLDAVKETLQ